MRYPGEADGVSLDIRGGVRGRQSPCTANVADHALDPGSQSARARFRPSLDIQRRNAAGQELTRDISGLEQVLPLQPWISDRHLRSLGHIVRSRAEYGFDGTMHDPHQVVVDEIERHAVSRLRQSIKTLTWPSH